MEQSQIWRFPKKYKELFRNISDEDIWKIIRWLFLWDWKDLEWLNKAYYDIIKVDLDNLEKFVKDAGNGILWRDDCLICNVSKVKLYSSIPRTEIVITPLRNVEETH